MRRYIPALLVFFFVLAVMAWINTMPRWLAEIMPGAFLVGGLYVWLALGGDRNPGE